MDLTEGSIGWHRTRQWLDREIEYASLADTYDEYHEGYLWGLQVAYMNVRARFNTAEESARAAKTWQEMFG